jgi:lysozyme family protein
MDFPSEPVMTNLVVLQQENDKRWLHAHIIKQWLFDSRGKIAVANKARYLEVIRRLRALGSNMPDEAWVFIAVIHEREASMNFNTHLGQGDPLTDKHGHPIKTVHVPAHRGPFTGPDAWEQAAVDALWYCAPYAAKNNRDWSISGMLTYLERYNGLAYANAHAASPYIWAGTDQYKSGKVLVDHGPIVWSFVDPQPGCAGLILAIMALDTTVKFDEMPVVEAPSIVPAAEHVDLTPTSGVHDAVWLQTSLNELGAMPPLKVDGINGATTRTAVKAFQHSHHLLEDGKAGTGETIPAIEHALAEKRQAVAA